MLNKIETLWLESGKEKNLKVRFRDWNYKIKYFVIEGYSSNQDKLIGVLDNGEIIEFEKDNMGWELYFDGYEDFAKAV